MSTKRFLAAYLLSFLIIVLDTTLLYAQTVVRCPETEQLLKERWKWAIKENEHQGWNQSYWIGYSFVKPMSQNSFIGSFYSERRKNKPSLCEMLSLEPCVSEQRIKGSTHYLTMNDDFTIVDDGISDDREIPKEIAVLFEVPKNPTLKEPFRSIIVSNLSLHVDLKDEPVLWLGEADDSESVTFLQSMYDKQQSDKIQQKIITAIGLHKPSVVIVSFLSNILKDAERTEVRKEAAFWLSQTKADKALEVLLHSAEYDQSEEVREQAIFAISELGNDRAIDALISLAKKGRDKNVRGKAMFWLGQQASKKSVEALDDIVNEDGNDDVQKSAIFALTQLPDNRGVELLIKIAKTHQNPQVRKEAIFWLGQSEDERALNSLIEIVQK